MEKTSRIDGGGCVQGIIVGLAVWWMVSAGSVASAVAAEAQAALVGQPTGHRYEIPATLSSEERKWFKVFQEGNLLSEGWQDISAEILAKTLPEQRPSQKVALEKLGNKIGMEWCRPNQIRKVDSSMLREWGNILRTTARSNPQQLTKAIALIDQKVDAALD